MEIRFAKPFRLQRRTLARFLRNISENSGKRCANQILCLSLPSHKSYLKNTETKANDEQPIFTTCVRHYHLRQAGGQPPQKPQHRPRAPFAGPLARRAGQGQRNPVALECGHRPTEKPHRKLPPDTGRREPGARCGHPPVPRHLAHPENLHTRGTPAAERFGGHRAPVAGHPQGRGQPGRQRTERKPRGLLPSVRHGIHAPRQPARRHGIPRRGRGG